MAERLERLLADGQDSPTLRFGLGNAWLAGDPARAAVHLEAAVAQDPAYSAAWKLLGRARTALGEDAAAIVAYEQGIAAAKRSGDVQAAKEMQVFLKRLRKAGGDT
jgi:predicted Zn-dependent protease